MDADTWGRSDAVLDRAREGLDRDREAVLVTLVDVEGSAYRRPGAKRLLAPAGESVGTVVPGCLDARLERLAESVLDDGEATTATFDLRDDDTWGVGVGCDGTVTVLVEPLGSDLEPALDALAARRTVAVVTVIDSEGNRPPVGERAVFDTTGSPVTSHNIPWLDTHIAALLGNQDEPTTGAVTLDGPDGDVEVFVDWVEPPPQLVVFGVGPDVDPLVESARIAGFSPTVVGFRTSTAQQRFPDAEVVSTRPADIREAVEFDTDTVAVVATHNFVDDQVTVEQLLATPVPYIGIVGSRDRFERLVEALDGDRSPSADDRLYGPAGLDIGGETPGRIALSVVSEALAVRNDRAPRHLRDRGGPIHERRSPGSDGPQQ